MAKEIVNNKELLKEILNEIVAMYFAGISVKEALEQVKENLKN